MRLSNFVYIDQLNKKDLFTYYLSGEAINLTTSEVIKKLMYKVKDHYIIVNTNTNDFILSHGTISLSL
jgi:hypothetical protein